MWSSIQRLLSGSSLTARVFRGGAWLAIGSALTRLSGIIRIVVLGRMLTPFDFGVVAITLTAYQWLEQFSATGISTALIQKQGDAGPYLQTAWTINVLRGVTLSVLMFMAAPFMGNFFGSAEAIPMLQVTAVVYIIRGLQSPAVVCLRRELDFKTEVLWRLTGTITILATLIPLAIWLRNGWAMIIALLFSNTAETVFSYWASPFRPRPEIDRRRARELVQFGRWIAWNNILVFVSRTLDVVVVGRLLGTRFLGFYHLAKQFALMPTLEVGTFIGGLTLPAYSKLQREEDLRRAFLRVLTAMCTFMLPVSSFLAVFAGPVIRLALGERWAPVVSLVQILIWAGVVTALTEVIGQMIIRKGEPKLVFVSTLVQTTIVLAGFYPLSQRFGGIGIAMLLVVASLAALVVQLIFIQRLLQPRAVELLRTIAPGCLASLPFVAVRAFTDAATLPLSAQAAVGLLSLAISGAILSLEFRRSGVRQMLAGYR